MLARELKGKNSWYLSVRKPLHERGTQQVLQRQVDELEDVRVSEADAALVVLALTSQREVALSFQTVQDAAVFVYAAPRALAFKRCLFRADLWCVAFTGIKAACLHLRRTALLQLRNGRYEGVAFPHNVLRRGALQYRGSSGVFFERYAVCPAFE